jgi:ribonuclease HI
MFLKIYTDGGSLNNPGLAALAFLIFDENNKLLIKKSRPLGIESNNVAEYSAILAALEEVNNQVSAQKIKIEKVICYSDSSLIVNQLNGLFKIKNTKLRDFYFKIKVLEQKINLPIIYQYIPREKNYKADSLVKTTLKNIR